MQLQIPMVNCIGECLGQRGTDLDEVRLIAEFDLGLAVLQMANQRLDRTALIAENELGFTVLQHRAGQMAIRVRASTT